MLILIFVVQFAILARDLSLSLRMNESSSLEDIYYNTCFAYKIKARKTFPINWLLNFIECLKKDSELNSYYDIVKNFKFHSIETEGTNLKKIIVVVVGESARKTNFSLYGYARKTNPFLEKEKNLVVMKNAETVFNFTEKSYAVFLSRATHDNFKIVFSEPSLMKAFQEAGFYSFYINNQPLGRSIQYIYAHQSDQLVDLVKHTGTNSESYSTDQEILPFFNELIRKNKKEKVLIVIHSMGSHFRYSARYPKEYENFKPAMSRRINLSFVSRGKREEMVNSYDNSIVFTDYFISQLISALKLKKDYASILFYASDHGENLYDSKDTGFMHGGGKMTLYEKEIPLLIWYSEKYSQTLGDKIQILKRNLNLTVTTDYFFHSILDIAGIYIDENGERMSFANKKFSEK